MQPDLEEFRPYLSRFDLTEAEKDAYILALWKMLEQVTDRAFGIHPLQQVVDNRSEKDSSGKPLRVEFGDRNKKIENPPGGRKGIKDHAS